MNYDKEKIKKFHEYTIDDYNNGPQIEEIAKTRIVEETDRSFTQIGRRILIDDDIFTSPSVYEYLPGAGRIVAIGEEEFLIKSILKTKGIKKIEFEEEIKEFPKEVYDFNDAIILLSTKFYVKVFTELMKRIDYEERHPRLDRKYRIISIPERILGNKIIILDKNAIFWKKQKFHNKYTNKDEKIDIRIKPASAGKVDITIRSVNKIKYIDIERIKILEVKD